MAQTARVDPEQARFFIALGAVGFVRPAAELANVDIRRAELWAEAVPRPDWLARRQQAATHLFCVATEALEGARKLLREAEGADLEDPARKAVGLRELVMVAERFYAAALKLDKDVASHDDSGAALDLGLWRSTSGEAESAAAASGAGDRDA